MGALGRDGNFSGDSASHDLHDPMPQPASLPSPPTPRAAQPRRGARNRAARGVCVPTPSTRPALACPDSANPATNRARNKPRTHSLHSLHVSLSLSLSLSLLAVWMSQLKPGHTESIKLVGTILITHHSPVSLANHKIHHPVSIWLPSHPGHTNQPTHH